MKRRILKSKISKADRVALADTTLASRAEQLALDKLGRNHRNDAIKRAKAGEVVSAIALLKNLRDGAVRADSVNGVKYYRAPRSRDEKESEKLRAEAKCIREKLSADELDAIAYTSLDSHEQLVELVKFTKPKRAPIIARAEAGEEVCAIYERAKHIAARKELPSFDNQLIAIFQGIGREHVDRIYRVSLAASIDNEELEQLRQAEIESLLTSSQLPISDTTRAYKIEAEVEQVMSAGGTKLDIMSALDSNLEKARAAERDAMLVAEYAATKVLEARDDRLEIECLIEEVGAEQSEFEDAYTTVGDAEVTRFLIKKGHDAAGRRLRLWEPQEERLGEEDLDQMRGRGRIDLQMAGVIRQDCGRRIAPKIPDKSKVTMTTHKVAQPPRAAKHADAVERLYRQVADVTALRNAA